MAYRDLLNASGQIASQFLPAVSITNPLSDNLDCANNEIINCQALAGSAGNDIRLTALGVQDVILETDNLNTLIAQGNGDVQVVRGNLTVPEGIITVGGVEGASQVYDEKYNPPLLQFRWDSAPNDVIYEGSSASTNVQGYIKRFEVRTGGSGQLPAITLAGDETTYTLGETYGIQFVYVDSGINVNIFNPNNPLVPIHTIVPVVNNVYWYSCVDTAGEFDCVGMMVAPQTA